MLALYVPDEFARKNLNVEEHGQWKATQCRLFLLYIGMVALRSILHENSGIFIHFRKLCIATRLLCACTRIQFAENLMKEFVTEFSGLYDPSNTSTCMHALIHLSDDVTNLGPLDSFSAFPFENFLRHIKRTVHGT